MASLYKQCQAIGLLSIVVLGVLLTGCSNRESQVRDFMVEQCMVGGAPKKVCSCVVDEALEQFPVEQMDQHEKEGKGVFPPGYTAALDKAMLSCARKYAG